MNKLLLNLLIVIEIAFLYKQSDAQVRLNLYPFNNTLGVSIGSFQTTNLELRTAVFYSSSDEGSFGLEPEIIASFRISGNDFYRLFIGTGIGLGYNHPGSGYISALVPLGFSIKPFDKLPEFLIQTELSPAVRFYGDYITLKLQPRLGLCIEL